MSVVDLSLMNNENYNDYFKPKKFTLNDTKVKGEWKNIKEYQHLYYMQIRKEKRKMGTKAKSMFEKLGYKELIKHNSYMFYIKELNENPEYENDYIHLEFNFKNKTICKTYGDDNSVCEITLEELQAINKQVEELGWK